MVQMVISKELVILYPGIHTVLYYELLVICVSLVLFQSSQEPIKEECLTCGDMIPVTVLRHHMEECFKRYNFVALRTFAFI